MDSSQPPRDGIVNNARNLVTGIFHSARESLSEIGRFVLSPPLREINNVSRTIPILPWQQPPTISSEQLFQAHFADDSSQRINEFIQWFEGHTEMTNEPVPRPLPRSARANIRLHDDLSKETENCPICLDPLSQSVNNHKSVSELPCGHSFHTSCIDKWFTTSPDCPVCRCDLREMSLSVKTINIRVRLRTGEVKKYQVGHSDKVVELANKMTGGATRTVFLHLGKRISLSETFTGQDIQEGDLLVEWVCM